MSFNISRIIFANFRPLNNVDSQHYLVVTEIVLMSQNNNSTVITTEKESLK